MTEEGVEISTPEPQAEQDPLSTLDEGTLAYIKQEYVSKKEVEKQVGQVKSAEQRRAEQERQRAIELERKYTEAADYNRQWNEYYEAQEKAKLQQADPSEQANFYRTQAERDRQALQQAIAYAQQYEANRQYQETANQRWNDLCAAVGDETGVPVKPDDPEFLDIRKKYERQWDLPVRVMAHASKKQKNESTVADANRVPVSTPTAARKARDFGTMSQVDFEAFKKKVKAGQV